jgi:hypothetical protein
MTILLSLSWFSIRKTIYICKMIWKSVTKIEQKIILSDKQMNDTWKIRGVSYKFKYILFENLMIDRENQFECLYLKQSSLKTLKVFFKNMVIDPKQEENMYILCQKNYKCSFLGWNYVPILLWYSSICVCKITCNWQC